MPDKSLLPGSWKIVFWTVSLHGRRGKGALRKLYKSANPFRRALPSGPNHLPSAPPPNTIALGIRCQHMNFGGTRSAAAFSGVEEGAKESKALALLRVELSSHFPFLSLHGGDRSRGIDLGA